MRSVEKETVSFDFINMLRGIAAILVIYFHLQIHVFCHYPVKQIQPGTFTYRFILGDFDLGKYAVGIFFIVSGFLIPSTLAHKGASLKSYSIHRFFRLYPAYWFSILVFLVTDSWFTAHPHFNLKQILINVTMLQKFVGVQDLIGAYWTLQIELIFYFICGVLFVLGKLDKRKEMIHLSLIAAMLCAVLRFYSKKELPIALFIALALMFLGDTLRAYNKGSIKRSQFLQSSVVVGICLLPICFVGYTGEGMRYVLTYWMAMGTFYGAYKYRHVFHDNAFLRTKSKFLADCSYSTYLLHSPVGLVLGATLFSLYHNRWLAAVCAIGSTLFVAHFTYRWIENPGIQFGKRLTRKKPSITPVIESYPVTAEP